jgi:hypothetical protein
MDAQNIFTVSISAVCTHDPNMGSNILNQHASVLSFAATSFWKNRHLTVNFSNITDS